MNRFRIFVFQTFILLATPAAFLAADESTIRFATFNIAMGLNEQGELNRRLQSGQDEALKKVAAIIQKVRPDVLLINEFDCCEADSAMFFINNYLALSQHGQKPISFAQF